MAVVNGKYATPLSFLGDHLPNDYTIGTGGNKGNKVFNGKMIDVKLKKHWKATNYQVSSPDYCRPSKGTAIIQWIPLPLRPNSDEWGGLQTEP